MPAPFDRRLSRRSMHQSNYSQPHNPGPYAPLPGPYTPSPSVCNPNQADWRTPGDPANCMAYDRIMQFLGSNPGPTAQNGMEAVGALVPASGIVALFGMNGPDLKDNNDPLNFEAISLAVKLFARGVVTESYIEMLLATTSAKQVIKLLIRRF